MSFTIKTLYVLFVFMLLSIKGIAQQQIEYSQYMYMPSIINPAYVGVDQVMKISLLHRSQWVGITGAPSTQTLSISTPLDQKLGLGFSLIQDEVGPVSDLNTSLDISYELQLNDDGLNFSFGMKGALQFLSIDYNKLTTENSNDPLLNGNITSRISPNIGIGVYLYDDTWYLGASIPSLLKTEYYTTDNFSTTINTSTYFYLTGGMNFNLKDDIKLKPAFLLKSITDTPVSSDLSLDLSLNILFYNKFTTGLSYNHNNSFSGLVDIKVSNSLSMGFAYTTDRSDISSYFSGSSHEILLRYYFNNLLKNVQQPSWLF